MSELAKALAKAQSEFPAIERSKDVEVSGTNKAGKPFKYTFSYAPLDAILHAVRPVLTSNGLAFSQLLANVDGKPALKTVLLHEGGESLEDSCPLPSNGSLSAQEFGSLVTYFRRYALVALLGIATEEDDDGNHASGNTATRSGAGSATATEHAPDNPADEAYQAYLEATARAQEKGAKPSDQVCHFGRNKGTTLGQMTAAQLRWYAEDWEMQADPSPYDVRLKLAAKALNAGNDSPDFDIPFS